MSQKPYLLLVTSFVPGTWCPRVEHPLFHIWDFLFGKLALERFGFGLFGVDHCRLWREGVLEFGTLVVPQTLQVPRGTGFWHRLRDR